MSLDIVNLIESNPITKLTGNYQSKLVEKIKNVFTEYEQQMFLSSFYCYLKHDSKNDFVIDLDNIWKWLGFSQKIRAKELLEKNFTINKATEEPFYRDFINLPFGSGNAQSIFGETALEQWKNKAKQRGFEQVTIDPSRAWNNFPVQLVYSPEQLEKEREIGQGIAQYYSNKKSGEFQGD